MSGPSCSSGINNLYIHVPFCDGKCDYCAFYSTTFSTARADSYLECLATEIDLFLESHQSLVPQTVYIGGGTPSALSTEQLSRLLEIVNARIDTSRLIEWTVEMNPGDFDPSLPDILLAAGVTRVSLGAQIFDDEALRAIGRRHTVPDVTDTVKLLRSAGIQNYNVDLISSLPDVSESLWIDSLNKAVELEPTHISVYNFSVEQGTVMAQKDYNGLLPPVSDKQQLQLLKQAETILNSAGYSRYEISNYAVPGFESRHNLACWHGGDYVGFGPSASSRIGSRRRTNNADLNSYTEAIAKNKLPPSIKEVVVEEVDLLERFMFGFRLTAGVDLKKFTQKYSPAPQQLSHWQEVLRRLVAEKLLLQDEERYYPTPYGLGCADYIAGEFLV
ncbi:MAG: radical SAM family heme chaperone HemW [Kiritimatiellae bacterium]|nr:radical SAM family heme chaperone HemW [Kiritimatiellia bacterium]